MDYASADFWGGQVGVKVLHHPDIRLGFGDGADYFPVGSVEATPEDGSGQGEQRPGFLSIDRHRVNGRSPGGVGVEPFPIGRPANQAAEFSGPRQESLAGIFQGKNPDPSLQTTILRVVHAIPVDGELLAVRRKARIEHPSHHFVCQKRPLFQCVRVKKVKIPISRLLVEDLGFGHPDYSSGASCFCTWDSSEVTSIGIHGPYLVACLVVGNEDYTLSIQRPGGANAVAVQKRELRLLSAFYRHPENVRLAMTS